MYCWNCGQKNADGNKFCGECGKSLLSPGSSTTQPDKTVTPRIESKRIPGITEKAAQPTQPAPSKPDSGLRPVDGAETPRAKLTNPLIEEPRVVRETLTPVQSPTPQSRPSEKPADKSRTSETPTQTSRPRETPSTATTPHSTSMASVIADHSLLTRDPQDSKVSSSNFSNSEDSNLLARARLNTVRANAERDTAVLGANRITGPSFLGLSDEPRLADDSGSYLLEDESEGSSWRGYLALAFLLVIGILILRQWTEFRGVASDFAQKMGIGDAPRPVKAKPTVSASNGAPSSEPTATAGDNADPSASSPTAPQEVAKAKPSESLGAGKPENDAASTTKGENTDATTKAGSKDEDATADTSTEKSGAKPSPSKAAAAAPTPTDNSQVDLAQKYLQGKGVPQDCNRGVSLLRSAARQANPKARIQMGALYLSGHCVEQDLPQAYSWFAQAQELEPHNSWIERNLNSLWSKMTDEERRRVLR
ncbi:MAG: Sel1 [Acidobacteriales bacterium]|nr:Sel1 [Terriglobales bacterium]